MSRKGLSSVVTNVLIILIVLAIIATLWAVLGGFLQQSAEETTADCFTLSVEPIKCEYTEFNNNFNAQIQVKRAVGQGDLSKIRFVFEDASAMTEQKDSDDVYEVPVGSSSISNPATIQELGSATYLFNLETEPRVARVAPITNEGNKLCAPTGVISCKKIVFESGCADFAIAYGTIDADDLFKYLDDWFAFQNGTNNVTSDWCRGREVLGGVNGLKECLDFAEDPEVTVSDLYGFLQSWSQQSGAPYNTALCADRPV